MPIEVETTEGEIRTDSFFDLRHFVGPFRVPRYFRRSMVHVMGLQSRLCRRRCRRRNRVFRCRL